MPTAAPGGQVCPLHWQRHCGMGRWCWLRDCTPAAPLTRCFSLLFGTLWAGRSLYSEW